MRKQLFAVAFVALCAAYLMLLPRLAPVPAALLKILPIVMLAARAASRAGGSDRVPLVLALLSSLAGDVLLALAPGTLFVQGVAAFLLAHVLYILAFRRHIRYSTRSAVLAAVVIAWCIAIAWVVVPHLGAMRGPVLAYMVVIAVMGVSAAFASGSQVTLIAGALAFILSDSILATDRFVAHFQLAPYLVMTTYYFGQFFIVQGVLRLPTASIRADAPAGTDH